MTVHRWPAQADTRATTHHWTESEKLLVALCDIGQILPRSALARLAKIEQIAEEVADGGGDGGGRRASFG